MMIVGSMPSLEERIAAGMTPEQFDRFAKMTVDQLARMAQAQRREAEQDRHIYDESIRRAIAIDAILIGRMAEQEADRCVVDGVALVPHADQSGLLRVRVS